MEDFIGYEDLHRVYDHIYRSSKCKLLLCYLLLEKVMESIVFHIISVF